MSQAGFARDAFACLVIASLAVSAACAEPPRVTVTLLDAGAAPRIDTKAFPDQIAGTTAARASGRIVAAWFAEPVTSYGHNVLGELPEAKTVRARLRSGEVLGYRLSGNAVFEDVTVRLADLDGDGTPELLVIKSRPGVGSSLLVLRLASGRLEQWVETAPIGTHFRWLNPIGAADLDGDGGVEVALVTTPHIGGVLRIYRLRNDALVEIAQAAGFSNHALGSRALGLHAFIDIDGDGTPEIVLPSADRRAIRVMRLRAGQLESLDTVPLADRVEGDFKVDPVTRSVLVPLSDGRTARLVWR